MGKGKKSKNNKAIPFKKNSVSGFKAESTEKAVIIRGMANVATADRSKEVIPGNVWELDNYKKNPILFFNHDRDFPIGKVTATNKSEKGLEVVATISKSKDPAISKVRDLVKEGILKTFSVGFDSSEEPKENEKGELEFKDAALLELSIVSLPMHQDSIFEVTQKDFKTKSYKEIKATILKAQGSTSEGGSENPHTHEFDIDEEGNGKTVSTSDGAGHAHDIEEFSVKEAGDDSHSHNLPESVKKNVHDSENEEDKGEEDSEDEQKKALKDAFQDCVAAKIPALLNEGKTQDEATSIAINHCSEEKGCKLADLTLTDYKELVTLSDELVKDHEENKEKQAVQGDENPIPTVPADDKTKDDFGNPQLEATKQTNILLGALINELKVLSAKLDGNMVQSEQDVQEEEEEEKDSDSLNDLDSSEEEGEEEEEKEKSLKYIQHTTKNIDEVLKSCNI